MKLEEIVSPTLALMIRQQPPPADLRGHILAQIKKWVPEGVPSVEQWLLDDHKTPPAPPPQPEARISVECTETGIESGQCNYACDYTRTGTVRIPESELHGLLAGASSREEAFSRFGELIDDEFQAEDDIERDSFSYENQEATESESNSRSHNAREVLAAYLTAHPELDPDGRPEEGDDDDSDEE